MFGDGETRCPVCLRLYGHLTGCQIPTLHEDLEVLIAKLLNDGYPIENLVAEVKDRCAQ